MISKISLQKLALILLVSVLFLTCRQEKETPQLTDNVRRIDGPYVFYEGTDTKVVGVNSSNQITKTDYSGELNVIVPEQMPEQFSLKLMNSIENPSSQYKKSDNIFVVSDIEGNYYSFAKLLIGNGITDAKLNWAFGDGDLVLVGDFVDRGEFVTQVLWLVYKLEMEAKEHGGQVHMIIGNHEAMLLEGDWRYTRLKYRELANALGIDIRELYGVSTELGRWLRSKNMIEKIGDILFVHGGISNTLLDKQLNLDEINRIAQENYGADLDNNNLEIANLLFGRYGPLWYRGLVKSYKDYYPKVNSEDIDRILSYYQAKNIVIGHCVVNDISTDFNGKVVRVDVEHPVTSDDKMESRALLIKDGGFYRMDDQGNKTKLN
ncbi:metallophosphoesterase [Carboxylicivirga taeanensis]|uniref:metallophosphoesterase n=1 Tax=Carboxylicivirga taeanensis TaxID=1416875 RepID=UPI003F6E4416